MNQDPSVFWMNLQMVSDFRKLVFLLGMLPFSKNQARTPSGQETYKTEYNWMEFETFTKEIT